MTALTDDKPAELMQQLHTAKARVAELEKALERIRDFDTPPRLAGEFCYYHSKFARDHARAILAKRRAT